MIVCMHCSKSIPNMSFIGDSLYGSSYLSRKHLKRAIKYGSYYGGAYGSVYGGATVVNTESGSVAAPVVHAPLYASRYYSKGGYQSSYGYALPHFIHGHNVVSSTAAPVVIDGHNVVSSTAAPVYASHGGIYGSSYLSRKHLKRAIKYGSYYGNGLY
jgi:hypothetical protein